MPLDLQLALVQFSMSVLLCVMLSYHHVIGKTIKNERLCWIGKMSVITK